MSSQQIFLHVGLPKTGTTYIQDRLWRNRDVAMRQANLLVPGNLIDDHFHAAVGMQPDRYLDWVDPNRAQAFGVLAGQAKDWPGRSIISHELFSTATADQAREAVATFGDREVHVVVTVRDLARQIPSTWQENIKNQYRTPYEEFVRSLADPNAPQDPFWEFQDYVQILRNWTVDVPPERVHVVTVPAPGANTDSLWERFVTMLGAQPSTLVRTVESTNATLTTEQAELLRRLNIRLQPDDIEWSRYEAMVKRELIGKVLFSEQKRAAYGLPVFAQQWAADRADEMIDFVRTQGYQVVGTLDDLRVSPSECPDIVPIDDAKVAEVAVDTLAAMMKTWPVPPTPQSVRTRAKRLARNGIRRGLAGATHLRNTASRVRNS